MILLYFLLNIDNGHSVLLMTIYYYLLPIHLFLKFYIFRFNTYLAKEIIQETLLKHLKDKEYSQIQAEILSKIIASEIKDSLKGFIYTK